MNPVRPLRFVLATLFLGASSLYAQSGFIQGMVRSEGGGPLGGMVVTAYTMAGEIASTTVSDGTGAYVLSLPAATYRVLAYDSAGTWTTSFYKDASSFETSAEITVGAGATRSGVDFTLKPGIKIHGLVETVGGTPLASMVVAAYNLDGTKRGSQKTSASGGYVLTVPAGDYKVVAWDDLLVYAPEFYANARSFETASTVRAAANVFGVNFSLERAAKVSGRVTAEVTNQPLGGVEISAYDASSGEKLAFTRTTAGGDFLFALPPGNYKFGAVDPKAVYEAEFSGNAPSFAAAASFSLAAGDWRSGLDFVLGEQKTPPAPMTLFIPAVINFPGAEGSYWRSDVWIYNPGQEALSVSITFVTATGVTLTRETSIAPRSQVELPNIVETFFSTSGLGSLRLSAPKPFAAVSRTFNTPPNASGTFGFSIPAMDAGATFGLAVLPGITQSSAYRTNVGIMNPHDHPVTVRARLYAGSGALVGDTTRTVAPGTVQQPSIAELFGTAAQVSGAYLLLSSDQGSFFSYASVVDNKSNDPTLVLPAAERP